MPEPSHEGYLSVLDSVTDTGFHFGMVTDLNQSSHVPDTEDKPNESFKSHMVKVIGPRRVKHSTTLPSVVISRQVATQLDADPNSVSASGESTKIDL